MILRNAAHQEHNYKRLQANGVTLVGPATFETDSFTIPFGDTNIIITKNVVMVDVNPDVYPILKGKVGYIPRFLRAGHSGPLALQLHASVSEAQLEELKGLPFIFRCYVLPVG